MYQMHEEDGDAEHWNAPSSLRACITMHLDKFISKFSNICFVCNIKFISWITTKFCTCPDSIAVRACAKFGGDRIDYIKIITHQSFLNLDL